MFFYRFFSQQFPNEILSFGSQWRQLEKQKVNSSQQTRKRRSMVNYANEKKRYTYFELKVVRIQQKCPSISLNENRDCSSQFTLLF